MPRETTIVEKDAYWYRLVVASVAQRIFKYSWGTGDMEHIYRADLKYLGRRQYTLSNRTYNGAPLPYPRGNSYTFKRRHRKRTHAYAITLRLIAHLLD